MSWTGDAWRYGLALLGVAGAVLAKLAIDRAVEPTPPYPLFAAAVLGVAWYGGRGPGLLATLLGAVAGYVFIPPVGALFKTDPAQGLRTLAFVLVGAFLAWLADRFHRATREAREQGEQFRLLVEGTRDHAAFLVDADGRVSSWNVGAERVFGYRAEEVVGTPLARLAAAGHERAGAPAPVPALPPADGRATGEGPLARRDGSRFWGEWVVTPLPAGGGPPRGFVAVVRNVTERWQSEAALLRSERRLALILEATSEGVWDWNLETGEVDYSPRWIESLGYSREEVPPHVSFWESLVHPDDLARTRQALRDHFEGRTPVYQCENRLRTKAGTWRWNLDRGRVVERDAAGKPVRMVGSDTDITERKRAEEEARAGRRQLELIADALPVLISYIDRDGRYQFNNAAYEQWFGLSREAIRGRPLRQVIGDAAYEAIRPHVEAVLAGDPRTFEGRLPYHGAGTRDVVVHYVPHRDDRGEVTGFYALIMDVSDRRQAEEAIRASEEKYRRIVETTNEGIWQLDADARVTFANGRMAELLGYRPDEVVGRLEWDFLFDEDQARGRELFERRRAGLSEECDVRFRHRDGRALWTLMAARPVTDDRGRFLGALDMFTDLTERKRAEEALHRSEARLSAIVRSAADAIVTIHPDGTVESVNPAAERMFGHPAEELVGRNVAVLMPSPYREEHDGYLARYHRTGVGHIIGRSVEVRGRRRDGTVFPLELTVSAVGDPPGLFTSILRDITVRKGLEREVLEAAAAEQRRIGQELHDTVGQELTGLGLLASALARRTEELDPVNAMLASRITEELGRVHQQVRALSRGLVPVEVDPDGLRAALEELAARTADLSGTECTFDWAGPVEVEDTGTATHLLRIAQEAVSNALRHGRPGRIWLALRADPGQLTLDVRDDGVGMPDAPADGGGLGIRLMRYRAGIIGGSLAVGPAAGGGTLVRCALPTRNPHVSQ